MKDSYSIVPQGNQSISIFQYLSFDMETIPVLSSDTIPPYNTLSTHKIAAQYLQLRTCPENVKIVK